MCTCNPSAECVEVGRSRGLVGQSSQNSQLQAGERLWKTPSVNLWLLYIPRTNSTLVQTQTQDSTQGEFVWLLLALKDHESFH